MDGQGRKKDGKGVPRPHAGLTLTDHVLTATNDSLSMSTKRTAVVIYDGCSPNISV